MSSSSKNNKRIKLSASFQEEEEEESRKEVEEQPFIPAALWDSIVSYLDIPELAKCAQVSKEMHAVVMKDTTWEAHVKELLQVVSDRAFYIERKARQFWEGHLPVPISERPLKSTNFRLWFKEWRGPYEIVLPGFDDERCRTWDLCWKVAVRGKRYDPSGIEIDICQLTTATAGEDYRWLVEDVPLRTYYKQAAEFAYQGYRYACYTEDAERCSRGDLDIVDYFYYARNDPYDYDEWLIGSECKLFHGMPNIRLFHGLARRFRYASSCYY